MKVSSSRRKSGEQQRECSQPGLPSLSGEQKKAVMDASRDYTSPWGLVDKTALTGEVLCRFYVEIYKKLRADVTASISDVIGIDLAAPTEGVLTPDAESWVRGRIEETIVREMLKQGPFAAEAGETGHVH